ncbi:hypothetical protein BJ742DRAFT_781026 [Cladochytrium replicatum]|nr:hypothetical protein BJ742DRAFT_781026 [Cladochytrium replicatum]
MKELQARISALGDVKMDLEILLAGAKGEVEAIRAEKHEEFVKTSLKISILKNSVGFLVTDKNNLKKELVKQKTIAEQVEKWSSKLFVEKACLQQKLEIAQGVRSMSFSFEFSAVSR